MILAARECVTMLRDAEVAGRSTLDEVTSQASGLTRNRFGSSNFFHVVIGKFQSFPNRQ